MIPKEELELMYWDKGMTTTEIGKLVGVSDVTIGNYMKKYGIELRTLSEAQLGNSVKPSKEELGEMYLVKSMSMPEIAKEIGVSWTSVRRWMKDYGIESRTISKSKTGKCTGENNGNWNGGTSFEPYCEKFNNKFREAVRKRDDCVCQLCGYEQLLGGQKLDVHHIHYDKENCYPDVVALCRSCHARVNGNRDGWEEYFEEQLIIRGLLNWSVSQSLS